MGGRKDRIQKMWQILKSKGQLELDPPVPSSSNVYLGMRQSNCEVPKELIAEKRKVFHEIMQKKDPRAETVAAPSPQGARTQQTPETGAAPSPQGVRT